MSDLKALIKQGEGISVEFKLGSGVRKLMKYGKAYGGSDPELVEGDIFRAIVHGLVSYEGNFNCLLKFIYMARDARTRLTLAG